MSWGLAAFATAAAVAWCAALFDPELRPNFIAEMWGVAGAGIVVWWFLEQRSEAVQRTAWLHANAGLASAVVAEIQLSARVSAEVALPSLGVPMEIIDEMINGATREQRRDAARRALGILAAGSMPEVSENETRALLDEERSWIPYIVQYGQATARLENHSVVGRLPELQFRISNYNFACTFFLTTLPPEPVTETPRDILVRMPGLTLSRATIGLCEACSDVLHAIGELP